MFEGKLIKRFIFKERRNRSVKAFGEFGWQVPLPSMAIYLWLPVPKWAQQRGLGDEELVADLLEKTGVALTPGSGFGKNGRGWIRLALVRPVEELEIAIARVEKWWRAKS